VWTHCPLTSIDVHAWIRAGSSEERLTLQERRLPPYLFASLSRARKLSLARIDDSEVRIE